jgi:hypothetical protein
MQSFVISRFEAPVGMEDMFGENPVKIELVYDATDIGKDIVALEWIIELLDASGQVLAAEGPNEKLLRSEEEHDLGTIIDAGSTALGNISARLRYRLFTSESLAAPKIPNGQLTAAAPKKGLTVTIQETPVKVSVVAQSGGYVAVTLDCDAAGSSERGDWRLVAIVQSDSGDESDGSALAEADRATLELGVSKPKKLSIEYCLLGANEWNEVTAK